MFKIDNLCIKLERENCIFHPGETINGSLDFTVKSEVLAQSIRLIVDGHSQFTTYEKKQNSGVSKIDAYDPHMKFFINFLAVIQQPSTHVLNPGDYSYRFEIKLPVNLPPSLEHGVIGMKFLFLISEYQSKMFKISFKKINEIFEHFKKR